VAEKIAARLELSGFFGLDFMIEDGTEALYLIEMNPRLAPPCHLRLGKGRDLVGALCAQLTGEPLTDLPPITECEMIAYRPPKGVVKTNQASVFYHDIPAGEHDLVREIRNPFPDRTVLFRVAQWIARNARKPESAESFKSPPGPTVIVDIDE
jgi:predicted ATP-grasp superfamily ATP-dependent carboligase